MANKVIFESAEIIFRNFRGEEGQYNREGDRNFAVLINDQKVIDDLIADGWNVKFLNAREEGDVEQAYLQVSVNFKGRPPVIYMITGKGKEPVNEEIVELLDYVDIREVDMILNPYDWNVGGKSGRKAYLEKMFVTIEEDVLDRKYADVPSADEALDRKYADHPSDEGYEED